MTPDEQRVSFGVRWAREHYKEMIVLRLLVAVWIVFVTVFACLKGYWWGLAFLLFLGGWCLSGRGGFDVRPSSHA